MKQIYCTSNRNKNKKSLSREEKKVLKQGKTKRVNLNNKKGMVRKGLFILTILFVIFLGFKGRTIYAILSNTGLNIDNPLATMFGDSGSKLPKDKYNHTNVLLLGVDSNREGVVGNVDTILVVSYDSKNNIAKMVSIPRDTVVQHTLKTDKKDWTNRYERINGMYSVGERELGEGSGIEYLSSVVTNYTGLEIHYGAMVNFQAVVKIVDSIGGIDVDVENSFVDYMYPTWNYSEYKTIRFTKGMTHMDGDTALKYSRSRHGTWPEGTDFARSRRQQIVISAIQNKITEEKKLQSIDFWTDLLENLGENVRLYKVGTSDLKITYDLFKKYGAPTMVGIVLDPSVANWSILGEGVISFGNSPQFAITPKPDYWDYSGVQTYLNTFRDLPYFIDEDATVAVYVAGGDYASVNTISKKLQKDYPYQRIIFYGVYPGVEIEGFYISDYSEGKNVSYKEYEKYLRDSYDQTSESLDEIKARNKEDIIILIGALE